MELGNCANVRMINASQSTPYSLISKQGLYFRREFPLRVCAASDLTTTTFSCFLQLPISAV